MKKGLLIVACLSLVLVAPSCGRRKDRAAKPPKKEMKKEMPKKKDMKPKAMKK